VSHPSIYVPFVVLVACLQLGLPTKSAARNAGPAAKPTVFHVTYVSESAIYIDAGRNADLQQGMTLSVVELPPDGTASEGVRFRGDAHIAEVRVTSAADSSAICEILEAKGELSAGQLAFLAPDSVEARLKTESATEAEKYPIVVTFTYGDPLDEEMREAVEKQATQDSPMSNLRGRFGIEYGGTTEDGGLATKQVGTVIDADMHHIGGSYWNFTGYWRGEFTSSSSSVANATLTDLINRTYHLGFTYQSPYSNDTMGVGRLYLPWAPSLSTIDGGYFGRKISRRLTAGVFAGSTPDPTSWSYAPNQHIAGTFVNFETGTFDTTRFFSTAGIALTTEYWRVARQFAFFENNYSWRHWLTFYNSAQIDAARTSPLPNGGSNPTGFSQSYTSLHIQPLSWLAFGVNHNYFRNLPTFDPRLIGTGLLDQYLFQGFSGDVRLQLPKHIALYSSLGRSKVSTDTKSSLNQAYGITFNRIWHTGLTADFHYSKFNSDFGGGQYESFSLSENLADNLHIQILGGHQVFNSSLTSNTNSNFVNCIADWNVGARMFMEGTLGWYQGNALSYRQWSTVLGYRFGGHHHQ
jgi:hypothetical protein